MAVRMDPPPKVDEQSSLAAEKHLIARKTLAKELVEQAVEYGGLAHSRAAGDDEKAIEQGGFDRFALAW